MADYLFKLIDDSQKKHDQHSYTIVDKSLSYHTVHFHMCSTYTWAHTHMPFVASLFNIHSLLSSIYVTSTYFYIFSSDPVVTGNFFSLTSSQLKSQYIL